LKGVGHDGFLAMKRLVLIPLLSALLGGGLVVAVIAAAGDLGGGNTQTVTEFQSAPSASSGGTATTTSSGQQKELSYHELYERAAPGVVFVSSTVLQRNESPFSFGTETQGQDTGSGIEVDSHGDILTNWHVVESAVKVTVGLQDGKTVEAKVIGKDPSEDLAVLRIPTEGVTLHPLTLGNSDLIEVGEPVAAIGNPFDLQRTLTTGVVSALQRRLEAPNHFTIYNVIQTDAPINPGNSGGPLLNVRGEVIGINSQIETAGTDGNIGIGFAVPINTAKAQLSRLESGQTVRGAYLGVEVVSVNGSLSALNLPVKTGALVEEVQKGSAAANAGIKGGDYTAETSNGPIAIGGDIITALNGKKITNAEELTRAVEAKQPGDTVTIELLRATGNGAYKKMDVKATLGERPNTAPGTSSQSQGGGGGNSTPELNAPEG
jgi:S1-C subfamily serine protease